MSRKRVLFGVILLLVFAMLLAACNGGNTTGNTAGNTGGDNAPANNTPAEEPAEAPAEEPAEGPMAMDVSIGAGERLDPATSSDAGVLAASDYIYDQLFRVEGGAVVGELALEWSVSDDGLTYDVRLRADAVFTDGVPVSTDVVVANFNRWFDAADGLHGADSGAYAAWQEYFLGFRGEVDADDQPISLFDGIEKVDDLNFLLHLNEPMDNFLEILAMPQFSILSPEILGAVGAEYGAQGNLVIGSGPYAVASWDAEGLQLVPSSSYWGDAAEGEVFFPAE